MAMLYTLNSMFNLNPTIYQRALDNDKATRKNGEPANQAALITQLFYMAM